MSVDNNFIDRILEGVASEEEAAEFQAWLQVPDNFERFVSRAELHADLRRSLNRRNIQKNALETNSDEVAASLNADAVRSSGFRSSSFLVLTGSALVTAACILIAFFWPEQTDPPNQATSIASVVSIVNGLLEKDGSSWTNEQLLPGNYELRKGLLNLKFGGGVLVYVEAPARFEATDNKHVVLYSGRLSARVPPEGIGFTVETPDAEVVDFGTEFSVDVGSGASEVHVFDGLVRVHPGTADPDTVSQSVELQASQALRISNGSVETEKISIATDRFIRNFDEPKWNYARLIKSMEPLAYYRMPIRDRGLVAQPLDHSGVVLTGEGKRPPHARGVFAGGSLRVGADSAGRGGRVDSPPEFSTGQFSLSAFVYLESPTAEAVVSTNQQSSQGNFRLSLNESGRLQATVRCSNQELSTIIGGSPLPLKIWRHVVVTANGDQLELYEDGNLIDSRPCDTLAVSSADTLWLGTDAQATQIWNGRIDEVAFFDRALSAEEVSALFRTAQEEVARPK